MLRFSTLAVLLALALLLTNCKAGDSVKPAPTATELLSRRWLFNEFVVKTEAKQYVVTAPPSQSLTDGVWIFAANGTYTYLESSVSKTGKWALSNNDKTITITDARNSTLAFAITTLTPTAVELTTKAVDITKGPDLDDATVYSAQDRIIANTSILLVLSLDKQNGGTLDVSNEPQPKSLQLVQRGKAL